MTRSIRILVLGLFAASVAAWSAPQHTAVLYSDPLLQAGEKEYGLIRTTHNGTFTPEGWQISSRSSQLFIEFADALPHEGTIQVTIKGLMPAITDDWYPFSVWSRRTGEFYASNEVPMSYAMIKTDKKMIDTGVELFKFITCPFYGDTRSWETNYLTFAQIPSFSPNLEYTFKFVWDHQQIYFLINNVEVANSFINRELNVRQIEAFQYLLLGRDEGYGAMPGPIYKNLQILVPESDVKFSDVSQSTGAFIDRSTGGQAAAWADVNGDGLQDLYVTFYEKNNRLFIQNPDGSFSEEAEARSVAYSGTSMAACMADFSGDGAVDLFIADYGQSNKLFINTGNGNFIDRSLTSGISTAATQSVGALAIDVDNDDDLDLFVANNSAAPELYINRGSGIFDVRALPNAPAGAGGRAAAADVNNDGYVDIYYVRRNEPNVLLINDGTGRFSNQATDFNLAATDDFVSPTFLDWDNDGDLDLILTARETTAAPIPKIRFFENQGAMGFADRSETMNIQFWSYGAIPGDYNNDSWVDFYLPARRPYEPGRLYLNNQNGTFSLADGSGLEKIYADGRGGAAADFDDDGRLDLFVTSMGGTVDSKEYGRNYLLQNSSDASSNYLSVAIFDSTNHLNGLGAKVYVYRAGQLNAGTAALLGYREIQPWQGYQSQMSLEQHFGLGSEKAADVRVRLPNGQEMIRTYVSANTKLVIQPDMKVPYRQLLVKGDLQRAKVGEFLADSLTVRVVSQSNEAVSGRAVRFKVLKGGATLNGDFLNEVVVNTDQHGLARAKVKLGSVPGENNTAIEISSLNDQNIDLVNSPMQVTASTDVGNPYRLVLISGNEQTASIGQMCEAPLVVQVQDRFENPIPNHRVVFQVISGGGSINSGVAQIEVLSGPSGQAQVNWRLGPTVGGQQLQARSEFQSQALQNSPIAFQATATQPSLRLSIYSGNYQTGTVNHPLDQAFIVKVTNLQGAELANEPVLFSVVQGNGRFSGNSQITVLTNPSGLASTTATLGFTAGDTNQVFHATVAGAQGSPAVFKATALPANPAQIEEIGGNRQTGQAGALLANDFTVRVMDGFGNPISAYEVLFVVNQGQGTLNGASQARIQTDQTGVARVRYRLGSVVGNETVFARADGLQDSPIIFTAVVLPGNPNRLNKISGDNQRGDVGQVLPMPFVVSVSDTFGNPLLNQPVVFSVTRGDGRINSAVDYSTLTDLNGQASARLTMGTTEVINEVTVQSSYENRPLINSPMIFRATTGPGTPDSLVYVSGNYQLGRVNTALPQPFVVRITDANGIPVEGQDVEFEAISSGAHFSGQSKRTVKSNADGLAQIIASIGTEIGDNRYTYEVRAYRIEGMQKIRLNGNPDFPIIFTASGRLSTGTQVVNATANSNNLVGTVGTFLQDTLKVRVLDKLGLPAAGQPVVFRVIEGSSLFEGDYTSRTVLSGVDGTAAVRVKLSVRPGISRIRVTANDGVVDLQNTPLEFRVTSVIGAPTAQNSTLTADSTAVANGIQVANVKVTLKDTYGNPVPGKTVNLFTHGLDVTVLKPGQPTDADGIANASIASIRAGWVQVWSQVDGKVLPADTARIRFTSGPPTQVVTFGSGKVGEMGRLLADSVGVVVKDQFANPVSGVTVGFRVIAGNGSLVETGPFVTNNLGVAYVHWILGTPGEQVIEVAVPGVIAQPRTISAVALAAAPASITSAGGNQQIGLVNQTLADSFRVIVRDRDARPIPGILVQFAVNQGEGSFLPNSAVMTNISGQAAVLFRAGTSAGMHVITASVNGLTQKVQFNCVVQQQPEIALEYVAGNGQSARPNRVLNSLLQVYAKDAFSRPLVGVQVEFAVIAGGGSIVENQPATTDGNGLVSATWRMGTGGEQRVQARPYGLGGTPVEFVAQLLNSAPILQLPADTTIESGQLLAFTVLATDPDGDAIFLGARNLPAGAYFDSTYSRNFSWQPSREQAGTHLLKFIASDEYGATTQVDFQVIVQSTNRPPMILSYEPADTVLTFVYGETKFFNAQATDPDGDELTYTWRANGVYAGDSNSSVIYFAPGHLGEQVLVELVVDDGKRTTSVRWHLSLLGSFVELSLFETQIVDHHIALVWKTAREENNLGYFILRSRAENGHYEQLNEQPIAPDQTREYRFIDPSARAGEQWYYKLVDLGANGVQSEHGPIVAQLPLPTEVRLTQNYPNPFNPQTTISFELPKTMRVALAVFNVTGQFVSSLYEGELTAGYHDVVWNGTDQHGISVPSGVYLYRLVTQEHTMTRKLLLSK
ncbi:MAG TPA: Ig-like domain-containing protein [bacterium]|nr:Ig-like domain-containing protein [bacterium]HPG45598.1 Ig-like domain-containing protein [bacterium]HPM97623.1 Ig-like domain-containing protein [bacterium]